MKQVKGGQDRRDRQSRLNPVRKRFVLVRAELFLGELIFKRLIIKEISLFGKGAGAVLEPAKNQKKHHDRGDQGGNKGRCRRGSQIRHGNNILDRRGSGAAHGPGPAAGGNRSRKKASADVCLAEQLNRDRVDNKQYNKAADAAISQDTGNAHDDRRGETSFADAGNGSCQRFGGACKLVNRSK